MPDLFPEWKQAVIESVVVFDYGDVITLDWLQEKFDLYPPERGTARDFNEYQFRFLSAIDSFREALLVDHKRYLKNVRGLGYLVVAVEDHTGVVWDEFKNRIYKAISKANSTLSNVNLEKLSVAGRADNCVKLATLAALTSFNQKKVFKNERRELLSGTKEVEVCHQEAC
jgi:hypothetical protein